MEVDRARPSVEAILELQPDMATTQVTIVHVFSENVEAAGINQPNALRAAMELFEDHGVDVDFVEGSRHAP